MVKSHSFLESETMHKEKKGIIKKILNCVLRFFYVLLVLYIMMFMDTNPLMFQVESIAYGNYNVNEEKSDSPIKQFDYTRGYPDAKVTFSIMRLFVWHNFRHGYVWVFYSDQVESEMGNISSGNMYIVSKWEIEKNNGVWNIIDIDERP